MNATNALGMSKVERRLYNIAKKEIAKRNRAIFVIYQFWPLPNN